MANIGSHKKNILFGFRSNEIFNWFLQFGAKYYLMGGTICNFVISIIKLPLQSYNIIDPGRGYSFKRMVS